MKNVAMNRLGWLFVLALYAQSTHAARWVSLGGQVSETLCALQQCGQLVAVDTSSTYPPALQSLPKVGYHRQLGAEGVLSLRPDRVFATDEAGPPEVIAKLRASGLNLTLLDTRPQLESALATLESLGAYTGQSALAQRLVAGIRQDLASIQYPNRPKVVVLLQGGLVAGKNTAGDTMISLAQGQNVAQHEGYRPYSAESLLALQPDKIVIPSHAAAAVLPMLKQNPALARIPQVVMDSEYLLGLGPRLGKAAVELAQRIRVP
jgi:iron complex transport system substrate-binding protein